MPHRSRDSLTNGGLLPTTNEPSEEEALEVNQVWKRGVTIVRYSKKRITGSVDMGIRWSSIKRIFAIRARNLLAEEVLLLARTIEVAVGAGVALEAPGGTNVVESGHL